MVWESYNIQVFLHLIFDRASSPTIQSFTCKLCNTKASYSYMYSSGIAEMSTSLVFKLQKVITVPR